MLYRNEFNGKRDVLHFKMLQAAINENNTKKIENQREKNLSEKLFLPQKGLEQSVEKNDEELTGIFLLEVHRTITIFLRRNSIFTPH